MSRSAWTLIKNAKHFYVHTYRRAATFLIYSAALNVLLGIGIYYVHMNQPVRNFYASDGVTPPVMLTPLDEPNNTSEPLLASDAVAPGAKKVMPK